jgi:hypothetical protein
MDSAEKSPIYEMRPHQAIPADSDRVLEAGAPKEPRFHNAGMAPAASLREPETQSRHRKYCKPF